jgi:hypothetical protein
VCEHFYLREMRDPELTMRTNRRAYVLPSQIAMYIARQLTGASLEEIGREFGHRHHTTVLHSIDKVERMLSDKAWNSTIMRFMKAVALRLELDNLFKLDDGIGPLSSLADSEKRCRCSIAVLATASG